MTNTEKTTLCRENIWIDGCFDFTHFGHCNAILQSKKLFPELTFTMFPQGGNSCEYSNASCSGSKNLVIGVHNDKDILLNKGGHPVMAEQERYYHISQVRWCSSVYRDAPYVTDPRVMDSAQCEFVVHGDDIVLDVNGEDCYTKVREMGRFKTVKRTEGVSTTEIIHRILVEDYQTTEPVDDIARLLDMHMLQNLASGVDGHSPWCFVFQGNFDRVILPGGYGLDLDNTVLYIDETNDFDMFNVSNLETFQFLRTVFPGKKLIIGVGLPPSTTTTTTVSLTKDVNSRNKMVNTLQERCYNVLGYHSVDGLMILPELDALINVTVVNNATLRQLTKAHTSFNWKFQNVNKQVIVQRILQEKDHYIQRNIKKGMTYE